MPETTTLYEVNLETLYGAVDDGALDIKLPKHAKKELEAYLNCFAYAPEEASSATRRTSARRVPA